MYQIPEDFNPEDYRIAADQCVVNNGGCDHLCTSNKCSCLSGYLLAEDGKHCEGIPHAVECGAGYLHTHMHCPCKPLNIVSVL